MATTCHLYRDGAVETQELDPSLISEVVGKEGLLVWVDIEPPDEKSIAMLAEEFGFHELALEDCLHPHQRPKIEQYGSYYFLIAYGASVQDRRAVVEHEMAIFVGHNYLVTIRKDPAYDLEGVKKVWAAHRALATEGGGYLLYALLDHIVDGHFDALDAFEDLVEELENRVFITEGRAETRIEEAQAEIFRAKRELVDFRRRTAPLREVLDVMQRGGVDVVTPPLEPYYRDVYDHVLRSTDAADTLREMLTSALEGSQAVIGNRLNEVMKSLTSWAAMILVPTLIAGIYGMNFQHMPELNWLFGYPFALGLMLLSGTTLYLIFKRRGWL